MQRVYKIASLCVLTGFATLTLGSNYVYAVSATTAPEASPTTSTKTTPAPTDTKISCTELNGRFSTFTKNVNKQFTAFKEEWRTSKEANAKKVTDYTNKQNKLIEDLKKQKDTTAQQWVSLASNEDQKAAIKNLQDAVREAKVVRQEAFRDATIAYLNGLIAAWNTYKTTAKDAYQKEITDYPSLVLVPALSKERCVKNKTSLNLLNADKKKVVDARKAIVGKDGTAYKTYIDTKTKVLVPARDTARKMAKCVYDNTVIPKQVALFTAFGMKSDLTISAECKTLLKL